MKLEVDPARLKDLRTRIGMPLDTAAQKAKVGQDELRAWESRPTSLDIDTLRALAKVYRRNWYVFLLDEEVGLPARPTDFRTILGASTSVSTEALIAFDSADFLLQKVAALPRPYATGVALPSLAGLGPEPAAALVRATLGADVAEQKRHSDEYSTIRYWSKLLANAGIYVAQLSFPYQEVRAFCREGHGVPLVVVSSQDYPRGRTFSMLHELGHLLLGSNAMCRPKLESGAGSGEETFCNAFSAAMLMPSDQFARDPEALRLRGRRLQRGDARVLARSYGASELAAVRRLTTLGFVEQSVYDRLQSELDDAFGTDVSAPSGPHIRSQATRMVNENSRLFAAEVLDAHARGDITFRDVGVLLDGNLKHVGKVREELAK